VQRRQFLKWLAGAGLSVPAVSANAAAFVTPRTGRIPAEFEPVKAVWIGAAPDDADKMRVTAAMVAALSPHAPIRILTASEAETVAVKAALDRQGVAIKGVSFAAHPTATYFIRDPLVFAKDEHGETSVIDFKWNSYGLPDWCARHLYPGEPRRAERCSSFVDKQQDALDRWVASDQGAATIYTPLTLEGGAIEVNGRGVLLVSEQLALNRNSPMSRDAVHELLLRLPGISKVIWLAAGAAEDPHLQSTIEGQYVGWGTGGHTDEFVRFATPDTILLAWPSAPAARAHPVDRINRQRMQRNYEILSAATDQDGRRFTIVKVPTPPPIERQATLAATFQDGAMWSADTFPASENRRAGDTVVHVAAASYLNYVVVNGIVLAPSYAGYGADPVGEAHVAEILATAFPGRKIAFIDATALNWYGGGIHCATNCEPA